MKVNTLETKPEVSEEIQKIFSKHGIKPLDGVDGFWNAVEDISLMNSSDGDILHRLGKRWDNVPWTK